MPLSDTNPFWPYEGGQLDSKKFAGRAEARRTFSRHVEKTRGREKPPHRAWVIEGDRGYGKSAFAAWCEAFPEVFDVAEELLVVKIKAPQQDLGVSTFDQVLQSIREALWHAGQESRVNESRTKAIHQKFIKEKVYEKLGNAVTSNLRLGKLFDDTQASLSSRFVIETIRDSTTDIEKLKTIVIVLHDLGEYREDNERLSSVERNIVNLVNEFVETSPREGLSIVMILLTYPGFLDRIPPESSFRRRAGTISFSRLEPFSFADTEALTENALGDVGCDDSEVIEAWAEYLHAASGGIPDLVQSLGWQAYDMEQPKGILTPAAVVTAARTPGDIVLNKLIAQLSIRNIARGFFNEADAPLMRCLAEPPILKIDRQEKTEMEWKTFLRDACTASNNLIDGFWGKLKKSKFVLRGAHNNGGNPCYSFIAEAVRVNLYACTM